MQWIWHGFLVWCNRRAVGRQLKNPMESNVLYTVRLVTCLLVTHNIFSSFHRMVDFTCGKDYSRLWNQPVSRVCTSWWWLCNYGAFRRKLVRMLCSSQITQPPIIRSWYKTGSRNTQLTSGYCINFQSSSSLNPIEHV